MCLISPKGTKNRPFGQNLTLFEQTITFRSTFQKKVAKCAPFRRKARKIVDLAKTCIFSSKISRFGVLNIFSAKSCKMFHISRKSTKNRRFGKNLSLLQQTIMFRRLVNFSAKTASLCQKEPKIIDLAKTCNFSHKISRSGVLVNFLEKSCIKFLISPKGTKNRRFGKNLQLLEQTITFRRFGQLFRKKFQKVPHFAKMDKESSIWPKLGTLPANYHRFGVLVKFSAKSSKKCLISPERTKNRRFGQNLQLFDEPSRFVVLVNFSTKSCKKSLISPKSTKNPRLGKNLQFFEQFARNLLAIFRFGVFVNFSHKVPESASFCEKALKIVDLAKTCSVSNKLSRFGVFVKFLGKGCKKCLISPKRTKNRRFGQNSKLFEQTITFRRFGQLFSKKMQKVPHFAKKDEKSSIWPKLHLFQQTITFRRFAQLFSEKLQKVPHFIKKLEKSSIRNLAWKLSRFAVLVNFSAKSCRKCLISPKRTKNRRFGKNLQLFEQTITFRRFGQVLSKKFQNVPHFAKNHEKSSIWPKIKTLGANYHVLAFW